MKAKNTKNKKIICSFTQNGSCIAFAIAYTDPSFLGKTYRASNGFRLESDERPEIISRGKLYLSGHYRSSDICTYEFGSST